MRTPLNKAFKPLDKVKKEYSNKEFQKVADAVSQISETDQEQRRSYLEGIEKAKQTIQKAAQAREEAETELELDQLLEEERIARQKEQFFSKRLEIMDFTPRIPEKEYYDHLSVIDEVMQKEAEAFKKTAAGAMDTIIQARDKYFQLAKDADQLLSDLDHKANVLQSKYRYKKTDFQNMPSKYEEDRFEWTRHWVRYENGGRAYDLITSAQNGPWYDTVEVLRAADKIKPR